MGIIGFHSKSSHTTSYILDATPIDRHSQVTGLAGPGGSFQVFCQILNLERQSWVVLIYVWKSISLPNMNPTEVLLLSSFTLFVAFRITDRVCAVIIQFIRQIVIIYFAISLCNDLRMLFHQKFYVCNFILIIISSLTRKGGTRRKYLSTDNDDGYICSRIASPHFNFEW